MVQEKSPVFFYNVLKKTVLIFKCTVEFLCLTTAKFYGMNNVFLVRLKSSTPQKFSQVKSRI